MVVADKEKVVMKMSLRFSRRVEVLALALAMSVFRLAHAASGDWTGAANAAWTNHANWNATPYPSGSDAATFNGVGGGNTAIDLAGLSSIRRILFDTASVAPYTLGVGGTNGQTLVWESSGLILLTNGVVNTQTVDAILQLGTTTATGSYTSLNASAGSTLVLAGNVAGASSGGTAGTKSFVLAGAGHTVLSGVLSHGGASQISFNKTGTGTCTLSGDNLFKGNVTISDGILRLKTGGSLGVGAKTLTITGDLTLRKPSLQLAGTDGPVVVPSEVTLRTSNKQTGAILNESGTNTIAGRIELTSGDNDTHVWSYGGNLILSGVITAINTDRKLYLRGDGDGEVSGVIENGSTVALPVYRDVGSGTWTLTGANTYSGVTTVVTGTLAIAGSDGSINASSGMTVSTGAALRLDNRSDANNGDRLNDTAPVTLNNGSLAFAHNGGAADYSETAGALSVNGTTNMLITSQANEGRTSTLTFSSLTRVGSATLSITGEGLGESARNRIIITGQANGTVFTWISVNGSTLASYDSSRGLYGIGVPTTDIAAYGDTLVSNATSNVRINREGTTGPITLSESFTVIRSLTQNTGFGATVDTAGKTLRAETFLINDGKAGLTVGVAPSDGVVAAPVTGGALGFFNYSSNALTVNASVIDNVSPSSLAKYGSGDLVLAGSNTFSGLISIMGGALILDGTHALPGASGETIKLGSDSAPGRLAFLGSGGTIERVIDLAGTTHGAAIAQGGSGLLKFTSNFASSGQGNKTLTLDGSTDGIGELSGVFANGSGYTNKLTKAGSGTWVLSGVNTFSGDTEIQNGKLVLTQPNALSGTARVNFLNRAQNGLLELAHDGTGETPLNVNVGIGYNGVLVSGVATGDMGLNHTVGNLIMSLVTVSVVRASNVVNGSPSITVQSVSLNGGGTHTSTLNPTTADLFLGNVTMLSSPFSKTLRLDGTSSGNRVDGVIDNGIHTISVLKSNSSTWTLTGANTYTGTTSSTGGTLVLSGANGAIGNSRSITLAGNGILTLQNSTLNNNTNRLGDALPISLNAGTLGFNHDGGVADYSETAGPLTVAGGVNAIVAAQADEGKTSALTFASLACAGGSIDFVGTELGVNNRNKVLFASEPTLTNGVLGSWATVNGGALATYGSFGVTAYTNYTDLSAKGPSVVPDDANVNARINSEGVGGGITLSGSVTNRIYTLSQNVSYPATVTLASKTLLASGILIAPEKESLTIGSSAGDGTLSSLDTDGELILGNYSTNALTVNAALENNGTASSLIKNGSGDVVIQGATLFSGGTAVNAGSLTFVGHAYPQALAGGVSGNGTLIKSGTNLFHLLAANTYTGPTVINEGLVRVNQNTAFGTAAAGTFIADGAMLDVGCTPDVGGTRPVNGLNMEAENITVQGTGVNGQGAIVNSATGMQSYALGNVTLAGDTTFSAQTRWDLRSGTFAMNDFCLTKIGSDILAFTYENVVPGNAGTAQFDVQEGALRIQVSSRLNGSSANTIRLRGGTMLDLYRTTVAQDWGLVCESNSVLNVALDSSAPSQNCWAGPVAIDGEVIVTGGSGYVADLQGEISGAGSLLKTGSANITLSGTNNTYTGETRITGGRLIVTSLRNIGEACSLGRPPANKAAIKIGLTTTSYAIEYTGAGDTSDRPIDMAGTSGGVSFYHSGTGPLKLTANLAVSGSGAKTFAVRGNSAVPAEFAGTIANVGGNVIAVTKADSADWLLSGNNTYSGTTTKQGSGTLTCSGSNVCSGAINVTGGTLAYTGKNTCSGTHTVYAGGTLQIAGVNAFTGEARVNGGTLVHSGTNAQASGNIKLGYSAGSNGVMRVLPGASITGTGAFQIGNGTGSAGAFYMTGGTMARTPGDNQSNFIAGDGQNSYGYFNLSGGSLSNVRFQLGGTQDPRVGTGIGRVTGGNHAISSWMLIGRQTNSVGVLTLDGGIFNHVNANQNVALAYGGGRGELNLTGGTLNSPGRSVSVGQYVAYAATGIVNLCAGTLIANTITNVPGVGVAVVNFSGGTLKACVDAPLFLPPALSFVNVNGPFGTYSGGALIDTDGKNVTIGAPLSAPAGKGVASTVALVSQGSGYIGEPYVAIEGGGGLGATAVANMEDDGNGTYRVASVTVTAPGFNYTDIPSVTFKGGGTTNPAIAAPVVLVPNTSGGLTKLGAGTLTLSGVNTYTGTTMVADGTLKLGLANALPPNAPVTLAGGTLDLGGFTVTNDLTVISGAVTNGVLSTVLSPGGAGVIGTSTLTLTDATLAGTYLADVTMIGGSDLVAVMGSIDLSGMNLQLVGPGLLNRRKQYTLLTCSGTLTGKLTATLPDSRWKLVYLADGTVKLIYVDGTLIKVR